jgi:hypothetical protein
MTSHLALLSIAWNLPGLPILAAPATNLAAIQCGLAGSASCAKGDSVMKTTHVLASLLLLCAAVAVATPARANDGPNNCQPCKSWCPNDYQCKPLPNCPAPVCHGTCDDYQCKPLPKCPCVPKYMGCDDYKCKPLPKCPSLCFPLWYICGASQSAGARCASK